MHNDDNPDLRSMFSDTGLDTEIFGTMADGLSATLQSDLEASGFDTPED